MDYSRKGIKRKQHELSSKGVKIKKMVFTTLMKALLISVISATVMGVCLGIGMFKGIIATAPDISTIDVTPTGYATKLYDTEGHEMTKLVAENSNRTYVGMDKIPQELADALVAIEDERYYTHHGIDIKGIMRAAAIGVQDNFQFSQGASTITQQLIKNSVFDKWATGETKTERIKRKIQEQYLATELEKHMSKEEILELYANTINLGHNTLGVQAASLRYFGKPVYELDLSECVTLAGITKNPSAYDPITHPDANYDRRQLVLQKMKELGYIDDAQYEYCLNDDVYARINENNSQSTEDTVYSYFVDEVIEQTVEDLTELYINQGYTETQASNRAYNQLYSGGLQIYTTMDPKIQKMCDEIYADESNFPENTKWYLSYKLSIEHADGTTENFSSEMFKAYYKEKNKSFDMLYSSQDEAYSAIQAYEEAVMVEGDEIIGEKISLTPQPQVSLTIEEQSTGYVVAMIGGRGSKESSRSLNRASNTTRQPGSTFKVVSTYAPAIDQAGVTLATVFVDAPFNYENGRPVSNWYSSGYKGNCTVRYAIEQSLNIIAVKCLTYITPELGFDYLKDFGFTTLVERRVEPDGRITSDVQQALALGGITDGVTNMELNAAYATIANGGMYMEPILYTKIYDHDGNLLIDKAAEQDRHRVIKETTAFLLTDAMVGVVTKGTGGKVNFGGMAIAGKTGTTSKDKDVWFAGFTPYYTATTWTGYDNNENMKGKEVQLSKTLWRTVMSKLHENMEYKAFDIPSGIVQASVCSQSGKLPLPGLCTPITEYFAEGTVPTATCDVHVAGSICAATGLAACDTCPFKIQGVVGLTPQMDAALGSGGTGKCPHNEQFYADPNHTAVLQQQQAALAANGMNFSIDGY